MDCAGSALAQPPAITVPPGFMIEPYAEDIPGARTLRLGAQGTVFVSSRRGKVYALRDSDADGHADQRFVIAEGLNAPNGLDLLDGALYVAETERILRYPAIESALAKPPMPQVIRADLPSKSHHGNRYIGFGPDRKLYVAIGAPCNVCIPEKFQRDGRSLEFASLTRMDPDGANWEIVARGVRNSVGFDWHPGTRELWFTDNGRDHLGDDAPDCELNRLGKPGEHFGFPYCHAANLADPEFGKSQACASAIAPRAGLGAHVAPLGMRFYTGTQFPPRYRGQIFLAKHGSWNRSRKSGYTLNVLTLDGDAVVRDEVFASGFMVDEKTLGRPVDVLVLADGSLLVSDDHGGRIWRISYRPQSGAE